MVSFRLEVKVKLLTRDTDYAIRALSSMGSSGELVTADDLVKKTGVPKPFLRKILQILGKKGFVKSYKGIGGGFRLSLPGNSIKLVDVMEIFQGPLKLNECFFKKMVCPNRATCPLKKKVDKIEKYVVSQLEAITIGSLSA
ncbi:MAG: Rrf2 family transcriptional regulator [Candidatus Omnitrophota bacterium]|jgi:Rrf2 family protein